MVERAVGVEDLDAVVAGVGYGERAPQAYAGARRAVRLRARGAGHAGRASSSAGRPRRGSSRPQVGRRRQQQRCRVGELCVCEAGGTRCPKPGDKLAVGADDLHSVVARVRDRD